MNGGTTISLSGLAARLDAKLRGDGALPVRGVNTIDDAGADEICFLTSKKYQKQLAQSKAAAVLTAQEAADCPIAQLVVPDVNKALIAALRLFAPELSMLEGVHPTAAVEEDAVLGADVSVGAGAYIGHSVRVGDGTVIGSNCSIGEGTRIGARCRIDSNVAVYHGCRIGSDCVIQSNSTIGAAGFGYVYLDGRHQFIPHNGGVILEDGVEIGANSCVDRAKFGNTVIGAGTKIDNLVQVAHNVVIGRGCLLAGQAGVGGSCRFGDGVVLAGMAGVSDNKTIGAGTMVGAGSIVCTDTEPGRKVWGMPAIDSNMQIKSLSVFKKLPQMAKELKELLRRVEKLESSKND